MNIRELIKNTACGLCRALSEPEPTPIEPPPLEYVVMEVPWGIILTELEQIGLTAMEKSNKLPDFSFFYCLEEDWKAIIPRLTYSADHYISFPQSERRDCDDYSKKASADSSFELGLNTLQVWGDTPFGYHAFDLVRVGEMNWRIFEPNAGFECAGELMPLQNEYLWAAREWKV